MHRSRVILSVIASLGVCGAFAVGCSSDPATPAQDASVTDASVPDSAIADTSLPDTSVPDSAVADTSVPDASSDAQAVDASAACGTGPFQVFDPISAMIAGDTPQTSVTITTNICPAMATVPYKGTATLSVPSNTPFFFIATQTGNLTNLTSERNIKFAGFPKLGHVATMVSTSYAVAVDPAWGAATHALLQVVVNASTGTGACAAKDGISYTVVGHTEAVIRYANNGTTATGVPGTGGVLDTFISIRTTGTVASPEYITITQTKAGCKVDLTSADKLFFTGRAPMAAGTYTTFLSGEVTN